MSLLRAATWPLGRSLSSARIGANVGASSLYPPRRSIRSNTSACPAPPTAYAVADAGACADLLVLGRTLSGDLCRRLRPRAAHNGYRSRTSVTAMSSSAPGASPTGAIVVYVTTPSQEVAESLASKLVEAKLAACVNILPGVTSVYWWKGKVEKDPELLLIIKTREALLPDVTAFVRANHPYDEPEVIGLPILGGSPTYLRWLMASAAGSGEAVADTEASKGA